MNRRLWLAACACLVVAPLTVKAQPPRVYRIGILAGVPNAADDEKVWDGFYSDLRDFGYVEGRNVVIERRRYRDVSVELPAFAVELVRLDVDVVVAGAVPAPETARRATSRIPIVMTNHPDPLASGLVASLARPGGNVTGLSLSSTELRGKHLQLIKEAVPNLNRAAVLINRSIPTHVRELPEIEALGRSLDVQVFAVEARTPAEFSDAFATATRERARALISLGSAMLYNNRVALVEVAAKSRLPAIYGLAEFADAGGLMSYGPSIPAMHRRAAWYVDRILKGAQPGELPVEQPSKFELVINLKAAKALGLGIPQSILLRADRVIE